MAKKKNHYVPQFYLEKFTREDRPGYLWVYDKHVSEVRESRPYETGHENYFYRFVTRDGDVDTDSIEDMFMEQERRFNNLLPKIENEEALTIDDITDLIYFISSSLVRVPNHLKAVKKIHQSHTIPIMKEMAADKNTFHTKIREQNEYLVERSEDEIENFRQKLLRSEKDFIYDDSTKLFNMIDIYRGTAKIISEMHWYIARANPGLEFITSDNPVTTYNNIEHHTVFFGDAFKRDGVNVTFPLTPKYCAVSTWRTIKVADYSYVPITKEFNKRLNKLRALNASRFVYASYRTPQIEKLIFKTKGSEPTADIVKVPRS